ncbi:MAG TPA: ATPase [Dysgonomonas sp.]|nr:ATPase [Dysgonomonas sp.]
MILLADGGSTKVDWCLANENGIVERVFTGAMNPFFRPEEDMAEEIGQSLVPLLKNYSVGEVHFFGAGCAFPEVNRILHDAISVHIKCGVITIDSDLVAAARGLCGSEKGIACILGTGSNSCYYDGEKIKDQISPLGYILGDEGSGAVLGRLFIGACLKNQLTGGIKEQFLNQMNLTLSDILDKVYKQPMPNRFLAGTAPFIAQNIKDESIYNLVYNSFKDFFIRNVMQYDYRNNPVHFTGSVAYHFAEVLKHAAHDTAIRMGKIVQSPMEGLVEYYKKK